MRLSSEASPGTCSPCPSSTRQTLPLPATLIAQRRDRSRCGVSVLISEVLVTQGPWPSRAQRAAPRAQGRGNDGCAWLLGHLSMGSVLGCPFSCPFWDILGDLPPTVAPGPETVCLTSSRNSLNCFYCSPRPGLPQTRQENPVLGCALLPEVFL